MSELSRDEFCKKVCDELTEYDVRTLNDHGVSEDHLGVLGLEHADRSIALLKACDDLLFGRNLLLMVSRFFLSAATELDNQHKELYS